MCRAYRRPCCFILATAWGEGDDMTPYRKSLTHLLPMWYRIVMLCTFDYTFLCFLDGDCVLKRNIVQGKVILKTLTSVFRAGLQPVISVRRLFTSAKYRDNVEERHRVY